MNENFTAHLTKTGEIGFVERALASLVYVDGLPGVRPQEVVMFESGELGLVTALGEETVEVLNFSKTAIRAGSRVARTGQLLEIPVGEELLGTVIDPLGNSIDDLKPLPYFAERRPIHVIPGGIQARARITRQCETGVSLIDLILPLGKGQRELIIGDQKTGKSHFLFRVLLSQVRQGAVGIYAVIGKSQLVIKQVVEGLTSRGILDRVIVVAAGADDAAGKIFLAPATAMTIAEYFRDQGRDVVVVLDDLTTHAKVYREISLLGRRFPGRNSYPADIFYEHSRLLERAGNFLGPNGDVSITCLPVAETVHGDLTGYIQTNIMSMTDGHIFFDHNLFIEGRRPAIDPFLSVTRVGRQTQSPLKQEITRTLVSFLRSVERLHSFTSFGAELGEHVQLMLAKEERLLLFFDQTNYDVIAANVQILLFGMLWSDFWLKKTLNEIRGIFQQAGYFYETHPKFRERIDAFLMNISSLDALIAGLKKFDLVNELQ